MKSQEKNETFKIEFCWGFLCHHRQIQQQNHSHLCDVPLSQAATTASKWLVKKGLKVKIRNIWSMWENSEPSSEDLSSAVFNPALMIRWIPVLHLFLCKTILFCLTCEGGGGGGGAAASSPSCCLSSGWTGRWRSDTPRLCQTRPPRWSTRSSTPGGTAHLRPSLPAWARQPGRVSSPPSSVSCSSASCPTVFGTAAPHLPSPCSSWRTWLDTESGTSHVWVTQHTDV